MRQRRVGRLNLVMIQSARPTRYFSGSEICPGLASVSWFKEANRWVHETYEVRQKSSAGVRDVTTKESL